MDKTKLEAQSMTRQFAVHPSESWYESVELPVTWQLVGNLAGKKVLDIGCASGWVAWSARKQGADVIASDIFQSFCHPSLDFVLGSKESLPFDNNSFDKVLTANVLHHGELEPGIKEIYRVLKPGGEFISLQEPCILNKTDETEYIRQNLKSETDLDIDEHRPSLEKYKRAFEMFDEIEFYQSNEPIFKKSEVKTLVVISDSNYFGGLAIRAKKL